VAGESLILFSFTFYKKLTGQTATHRKQIALQFLKVGIAHA
jgi:hypothetical protein